MLFPRWTEARRRHAENIAKAKAEGIAQGHSEVQQRWTAWNERRLQAKANGEPFNEPPPQ